MAALAGKGHAVVAAEPTAEPRALGQQIHDERGIEWIDDPLPEARGPLSRGQRCDLVLLTAVRMHLDERQRPLTMKSIADLLVREGRVVLSLRHAPVRAGQRMLRGDGAYSSRVNGAHLRRRGIGCTIPEPADQVRNRRRCGPRGGGRPPFLDREDYKARHAVECGIAVSSNTGPVAPRFDNIAVRFEATVQVAAIHQWL